MGFWGDDMSKEIGVPVKPFFAGNYNVLIEAMRFNQTQVAWFSAKPALEAVDRAQGEVVARIVDPEGRDSYTSTLVVKKDVRASRTFCCCCDY